MKFHPDKCKVLNLGSQHNNHMYQLHSIDENTNEIAVVNLTNIIDLDEKDRFEKDLGVLIDPELSFTKHMSSKIKKANSITGLIRRSFTTLNEESFLVLYKALVRPHL